MSPFSVRLLTFSDFSVPCFTSNDKQKLGKVILVPVWYTKTVPAVLQVQGTFPRRHVVTHD